MSTTPLARICEALGSLPPTTLTVARLGTLMMVAIWSAFQLGLLGYSLDRAIPVEEIRSGQQNGYIWSVPNSAFITADSVDIQRSRLILLEDGHVLGLAHSTPTEINELGSGRYRHRHAALYFSTGDNSDPRSNGRHYRIQVPLSPPHTLSALLVLMLVVTFVGPAGRAYRWLEQAHPVWPTLLLMLLATTYRAAIWMVYGQDSLGGVAVKGLPFSDASIWNFRAIDFSQGTDAFWPWINAWDARRPGYTWILGGVYSLTGESLSAARCLNIAAGVLSTALIFDMFRRVTPFAVALLAGASYAVLTQDAVGALTTMTEPLGAFLTNVTVWMVVVAMASLAADGRLRPIALKLLLAGALLSLSNLVRPLTLLAAAPLALVPFIALRRRGKLTLRVAVGAALLFSVGVTLVLTPWLARQYQQYGILSISDNTAEMLYAATTPEYGAWTSAVSSLPDNGAIVERYQFYKRGISEHLAQHKAWYLKNIVVSVARGINELPPRRWLLFSLMLLFFLHYRQQIPRFRWPLPAVVVLLIALLYSPIPYSYMVGMAAIAGVSSVVVLIRRHPLSPVVLVLATSLISMGLMGFASRRMTQSLEWMATGLILWAVWRVLVRCSGVTESPQPQPFWGATGRSFTWLGVAVGLLLVSASATAGVKSIHPTPTPSTTIAKAQMTAYQDAISAYVPEQSLPDGANRIKGSRVHLIYGRVMYFEAGEDINHWSPLFDPRPYPYSAFYTYPPIADGPVVIPGKLPDWAVSGEWIDVLAVSAIRPHGNSVEAFALIPTTSGDGQLWLPDRDLLAAHLSYLQSATRVGK